MIPFLACLLSGLAALPAPAEPRRASLSETLEQLVRKAESYEARVGLVVRSLGRGETLFRRNGDRLFSAASNTKLVTTAAALYLLGPEYRFETKFLAAAPTPEGILEGDLWVVGGGDPCWSGRFFEGNAVAPFEALAEALRKRGVLRIAGEIVLDDRFFDRVHVAPGWPSDQLSFDYCAPVSALSLNEGCVEVELLPNGAGRAPAVRLSPAGAAFPLQNEAETRSGKGDPRIDLRFGAEGGLRLRGTLYAANGSFRTKVAVPSPAQFFGDALRDSLVRAGIPIERAPRLVRDGESPPSGLETVYLHRSPIYNALHLANKESENFYAEHLLKTLGAEIAGEGSWAGGVRAIRRFLEAQRIPDSGFAMEDGSGLSRGNRFSPDFLVALLSKAYEGKHREIYLRTLPVSGVDGTLEKRLREEPYRGRVLAKTGWIQGASSLSGYARGRDGEFLAFSLLVNYEGKTNNKVFKEIADSVCRALIDLPAAR